MIFGERGRNRTYNLVIKSHLLCQLSYAPDSEGWMSAAIAANASHVTIGRFRTTTIRLDLARW
jgi:hypothetical protein